MTERPQADKDYILAILHDYPRIRKVLSGKENINAILGGLAESILNDLIKEHELERLENALFFLEELAQRGQEAFEKKREDQQVDAALTKENNITKLNAFLKSAFTSGDLEDFVDLLTIFAEKNKLPFKSSGKKSAGHVYFDTADNIQAAKQCYLDKDENFNIEFAVRVEADFMEAFYRNLDVPEDSEYHEGNIPWSKL